MISGKFARAHAQTLLGVTIVTVLSRSAAFLPRVLGHSDFHGPRAKSCRGFPHKTTAALRELRHTSATARGVGPELKLSPRHNEHSQSPLARGVKSAKDDPLTFSSTRHGVSLDCEGLSVRHAVDGTYLVTAARRNRNCPKAYIQFCADSCFQYKLQPRKGKTARSSRNKLRVKSPETPHHKATESPSSLGFLIWSPSGTMFGTTLCPLTLLQVQRTSDVSHVVSNSPSSARLRGDCHNHRGASTIFRPRCRQVANEAYVHERLTP